MYCDKNKHDAQNDWGRVHLMSKIKIWELIATKMCTHTTTDNVEVR